MPQSKFRNPLSSVVDIVSGVLAKGGGSDEVEVWWEEILRFACISPKLNQFISIRPIPREKILRVEMGLVNPGIENGFRAELKSSPHAGETPLPPLPSRVHPISIDEHEAFCRFIKRRVESLGRFLSVAQGIQYGQFHESINDGHQNLKIDAYLHQAEHGRIHVFQLTYLDLQ
jgi:hypothetical protein